MGINRGRLKWLHEAEYPNDSFRVCVPSSFIISCGPVLPVSDPWRNNVGADPWAGGFQSHDDVFLIIGRLHRHYRRCPTLSHRWFALGRALVPARAVGGSGMPSGTLNSVVSYRSLHAPLCPCGELCPGAIPPYIGSDLQWRGSRKSPTG